MIDKLALISLIRDNPILYDKSNKYFRKNSVKITVWQQICKQLGCSGKEVASTWKSLKSHYIRLMAKTTTEVSFTRKWPHEDSLSFLFPFIEDKIKTNYSEFQKFLEKSKVPGDENQSKENSITSTEKSIEEILNNTNDISEYLTSIIDTMIEWPSDKQESFQKEVEQLILQAEEEYRMSEKLKVAQKKFENNDDDVVIVENEPPEIIELESDDDKDNDDDEAIKDTKNIKIDIESEKMLEEIVLQVFSENGSSQTEKEYIVEIISENSIDETENNIAKENSVKETENVSKNVPKEINNSENEISMKTATESVTKENSTDEIKHNDENSTNEMQNTAQNTVRKTENVAKECVEEKSRNSTKEIFENKLKNIIQEYFVSETDNTAQENHMNESEDYVEIISVNENEDENPMEKTSVNENLSENLVEKNSVNASEGENVVEEIFVIENEGENPVEKIFVDENLSENPIEEVFVNENEEKNTIKENLIDENEEESGVIAKKRKLE